MAITDRRKRDYTLWEVFLASCFNRYFHLLFLVDNGFLRLQTNLCIRSKLFPNALAIAQFAFSGEPAN